MNWINKGAIEKLYHSTKIGHLNSRFICQNTYSSKA